jgi:hypothetical protein
MLLREGPTSPGMVRGKVRRRQTGGGRVIDPYDGKGKDKMCVVRGGCKRMTGGSRLSVSGWWDLEDGK